MNKQIETTMATKATYKRLGDYIRLVDIRNRDLKVETLLGLSIEKCFITSIANTIGTDMSTYKVVQPKQFAYGPVTSRNGDKITIALYDGEESIIISQAYSVFEITDEEHLCPDYLMMWFRRPEFDRYSRFKSHGSAREIFDWETMCDVMVPIPPIEEQRKTVAEYQALVKRIEINNQLIAKLEDTAQAIYRNMFVDDIDKENLPEGWRMGRLGELTESTLGGDWGKDSVSGNYTAKVKCMRGTDITLARIGNIDGVPTRYILEKNLISRQLFDNDIIIEISGGGPTQSTGRTFIMSNKFLMYHPFNFICSNFCRIIRCKKNYSQYFYSVINRLYSEDILFRFENSSNGVKNLDLQSLFDEKMVIPHISVIEIFNNRQSLLNDTILNIGFENNKIEKLQSLLLAKMGQ